MTGVLQGFVVIGTMIAVGFLTGRLRMLPETAEAVLARLVFFVMSPCLLITVLVGADVRLLLSGILVVSLIAAVLCMAVYALIARLIWHRPAPEMLIGSLAASFSNAGNIGIPVSVYVLGNAAYAAPVILLQIAVFTPIALASLDVMTANGPRSLRRTLTQPFRNPVMMATLVGVLISALQIRIPNFVVEPFRLIGNAYVPLVLIAFGMSLAGQRPFVPGSGRRDVLVAVLLKIVVMPLAAWALGRFVFGLESKDLLVVTVLAALPTAQGVFGFAQRYRRGEIVARDAGLLATVGSIPVLLLVTALLNR